MRCKLRTVASLLVAFLVVVLTCGTLSAQVINDFDTDLESWRFDFGAGGLIEHDPTEGSPGNPAGAAKMTFDFPGGGIAFTGDVFFPAMDLTGQPTLLFDVKVDTAASSLDAFGNYGFMDFVSRETDGYNWGGQAGRNLPASSDWQTFAVSTADGLGMSATRAFTLQLFGGGNQNIPDDVVLWLDNVRLVPEPSTLALAGCFGLIAIGSVRRREVSVKDE